MKKRNVNETSSYVGAAEDEGLYDAMGSLIEAASAMTDYELSSPEEAMEALYELGTVEAMELVEAIETLENEIDSVESEAYFNELDDEEGMDFGESYKSKKKIIKLTEGDLTRIVKKVIKEGMITELGGMEDSHPKFGNLNLSDYDGDELESILNDRLGDDDEYYGSFDDANKIDRFNNHIDSDYEDFDEEEFEDFDSYRNSRYGSDKNNRWSINNKKDGRRFFDSYQERAEGKPFKIRKKRR